MCHNTVHDDKYVCTAAAIELVSLSPKVLCSVYELRCMDLSQSHALITGGAGFIGSHLARDLLARGATVTVADDLSKGDRDRVPSDATFVRADLTEPDDVARDPPRERDEVPRRPLLQRHVPRQVDQVGLLVGVGQDAELHLNLPRRA